MTSVKLCVLLLAFLLSCSRAAKRSLYVLESQGNYALTAAEDEVEPIFTELLNLDESNLWWFQFQKQRNTVQICSALTSGSEQKCLGRANKSHFVSLVAKTRALDFEVKDVSAGSNSFDRSMMFKVPSEQRYLCVRLALSDDGRWPRLRTLLGSDQCHFTTMEMGSMEHFT